MSAPERRKIHLLLTGTVDPCGMSFTVRKDPATRMNDYRKALGKWARCECFDSMTFCENSAANLRPLEQEGIRGNPGQMDIYQISEPASSTRFSSLTTNRATQSRRFSTTSHFAHGKIQHCTPYNVGKEFVRSSSGEPNRPRAIF